MKVFLILFLVMQGLPAPIQNKQPMASLEECLSEYNRQMAEAAKGADDNVIAFGGGCVLERDASR